MDLNASDLNSVHLEGFLTSKPETIQQTSNDVSSFRSGCTFTIISQALNPIKTIDSLVVRILAYGSLAEKCRAWFGECQAIRLVGKIVSNPVDTFTSIEAVHIEMDHGYHQRWQEKKEWLAAQTSPA